MLGKLIKHEWKTTWKTILLINAFLIILTVLGIISFASKLWSIDNFFIQMTGISMLMLYYITIIGMVFAVNIYLYVHFYKNLYSSEGYLMHTLPVTPRQLIVSKLFLGSCYVLLTFCNIFVSVVLLLFSAMTAFGEINVSFSEIISSFKTEVIPLFMNELGMDFYSFILLLILSMIISAVSCVLMGFASVSLGQLYAKHKVLGSFIAYFGIQMVMQFLSIFLFLPISTNYMYVDYVDPASYIRISMLAGIGFSIVICIIYYIVTELVMRKQLNLD